MMNTEFFDDLESARDSVNTVLSVLDDDDPRRGDLYRVLSMIDRLLAETMEAKN